MQARTGNSATANYLTFCDMDKQETGTAKRYLTTREAAAYLGISLSYLHRLTSQRALRYYKPASRLLYFDVTDLDAWITGVPVVTADDLCATATASRKGGAV